MFRNTNICIVLVCYLIPCSVQDDLLQTKRLGNVAKLRVLNNHIYIGALNKIYGLNSDLGENFTIDTCKKSCLSNYNKVLLVREASNTAVEILTCGTGNEGRCQLWDPANTSEPTRISRPSLGSTNMSKSTEAAWLLNNLLISKGFDGQSNDTLLSSISSSTLDYEYSISIDTSGFLISFKTVVQHEGFTYFLTNQFAFKNDNRIVSKIIRICNRDDNNPFYSYHDMILECSINGTNYNLVQDAVIVKTEDGKSTLIAAFTKGSDPDNPVGPSQICSISLTQLTESFTQAALGYLNCSTSNGMIYLERTTGHCFNVSTFILCNE